MLVQIVPLVEPVQCSLRTVLLLEEKETISHYFAPDLCRDIKQFCNVLSPLKNLDKIKRKLCWSWSKIENIVSHLIYWNKARLIKTVNFNSQYIGHFHSYTNGVDTIITKEWLVKENDADELFYIATSISQGNLFGDILNENPTYSVEKLAEIVIKLLRFEVICEMETYLYLQLPIENGIFDFHHENLKSHELNTKILDAISKSIETPLESSMYETLICMLPYCNGYNSIDELCWKEKISRQSLNQLIKMLGTLLIKVNCRVI